jgi:hypothetical protein
MALFGHHMKGIIDLEIMGYELTPDGPTEHAIALAIVAVMTVLMGYGAYALIRDVVRWRRAKSERVRE